MAFNLQGALRAAAAVATGLNANSIRKACNRPIHKCLNRYFKFEEEVM